jgi:hypothetical protein
VTPLERAEQEPLSYVVRYLRTPDGRRLVVLGEAHLKLAAASALGKEIVRDFTLRGVETFPVHKVAMGRALWFLIHVPRLLLRVLSFGLIKGSTITDAKAIGEGSTFELERRSDIPLSLHVGAIYLAALFAVFWSYLVISIFRDVAWLRTLNVLFQLHFLLLIPAILLRRHSWSWLLHPAVAILTVRDQIMAEGTIAMFKEHHDPEAIVIMGRAHVAGYTRILTERYGFQGIASSK